MEEPSVKQQSGDTDSLQEPEQRRMRKIDPSSGPTYIKQDTVHEVKDSDEFEKFCKSVSLRLSVAICVFVVLAYLFGRLGWTWPFVLPLCFLAFWHWREKLSDVHTFAKREAELHEHRKRAFQHAETVEWLNFLINRW